MKRKTLYGIIKLLPELFCVITASCALLMFPDTAADGVRAGLRLSADTVIPSLFPFLVLSSFAASSPLLSRAGRAATPVTRALFNLPGEALTAVFLGLTAGYPIGAKTASELYCSGKITRPEAERTMLFSLNGGAAFIITAVGRAMLGSAAAGVILYASVTAGTLILGFLLRFFDDTRACAPPRVNAPSASPVSVSERLVLSVNSGSRAMLSVVSWVVGFSCIGALIGKSITSSYSGIILMGLLEVTTGTAAAAGVLPLGAIAAFLSFGGFSVICQVMPYMNSCGVSLKKVLTARIIAASFSSFICTRLCVVFPQALKTGGFPAAPTPELSAAIPASLALIVLCVIFIVDFEAKRLEVKKKMC